MSTFKKFMEGGKLFGNAAARVTNAELQSVYQELKSQIGDLFSRFESTKTLQSKQDHGDIDILVLAEPNVNIKDIVAQRLGSKIIQYSKNDNTHSILYYSKAINKQVHVDLIASTSPNAYDNKFHYYSLNDFSAAIGTVSKKLHFKYGSEGVFKRFQDQKTVWHDIPLPLGLLEGLKIFGFDMTLYSKIKNPDDIINFIASSPLVDGSFFVHEDLTSADRQAVNKRPIMDYILGELRKKNLHQTITDEDYFFKKYYPEAYQQTELKKQEINPSTYKNVPNFNGNWVMQTFGLKPGPQVGEIMKKMYQRFGNNLENTPSKEVIQYVKELLK